MILFLPKWLWGSLLILVSFYSLNLDIKIDVLYLTQSLITNQREGQIHLAIQPTFQL